MPTFANPTDLLQAEGQELGTSSWIQIDQDRINQFADCTGDHQWIHVDPERAKEGPYGTTIAHGYLTLSMAPVLLADVVQVDNVKAAVNYGLNKVRFPGPVPAGSRIRGHVTLIEATQRGPMIQVVFGLKVETEDSQTPACVAEIVALYS